MPLAERLQLLAEGLEMPVAAFDRDGTLVGASDAAGSLLDLFSPRPISSGRTAMRWCSGHVELSTSIGNMVLQRVGSGADVGLVALIIPHAVEAEPEPAPAEDAPQDVAPPAEMPIPAYEQPALANEAPAEFALIDEFAEPLDTEPVTHVTDMHSTEPPAAEPAPIESPDDRPDNRRTREAARRESAKHLAGTAASSAALHLADG